MLAVNLLLLRCLLGAVITRLWGIHSPMSLIDPATTLHRTWSTETHIFRYSSPTQGERDAS